MDEAIEMIIILYNYFYPTVNSITLQYIDFDGGNFYHYTIFILPNKLEEACAIFKKSLLKLEKSIKRKFMNLM